VVCTNNAQQGFAHGGNPRRADPDKPNAAQANRAGHILRIDEAGADMGALRFKWDVFVLCGDPSSASPVVKDEAGQRLHVSTAYEGKPTFHGERFACPDNICFDSAFNVWIATDGSDNVFGDCNDGVMVTSIGQTAPREVKRFLVGPVGCEICGPHLAPDESAFFCCIQHPGESDAAGVSVAALRWGQQRPPPSTFPNGGWPRSAVVYVRRKDGAKVNA
jgi:secreted PhoX family phosphatase